MPVRALACEKDISNPWAVCLFSLFLETTSFNKFCILFAILPDVKKQAVDFRRRSKGRVYAATARQTATLHETRLRVLVAILKRAPADNAWQPILRCYIQKFKRHTL